MKKKIEYYVEMARLLIDANKDNVDLYEKIDKAYDGEWELPQSISDLPGIRKFSSTDAHDAMAAAIKTLSQATVEPDVVSPAPGEDNALLAEQFERVIEHQFYLANKRSIQSPFRKMVESAVKYGGVAVQLERVDHKFPGSGKRDKNVRKNGDYAMVVHNFSSVYPKFSEYALEGVLLVQLMRLDAVIDAYGDVANKLVAELSSKDGDAMEAIDIFDTYVYVYDYTDYDEHIVWASLEENLNGGGYDPTVLLDAENKLPFLNWIYRRSDDPLMKAAIEANTIENFNILLSLRYYTVATLAAWPRMWSITPTGEGVDVDWTNIGGQVQMRVGEEAGMNQPPAMDEGLNRVIDDTQVKLHQATQISRALTSIENFAAGTPFSTINAMREAGIASLGETVGVLRDALQDTFCHMLYWAQYANKPMRARRYVTEDELDSRMMVGAEISLDMSQYNLDDWEIIVNIKPDTMTDKQGRRNLAIMDMERLHLGHKHAWEEAGIKNGKQAFEDWKNEQIELAKIEAEKQRIIGAVQVELQNAAMQAQQQAQQPPPQEQAQFSVAQGMDNRGGGNPVAPVAPQGTRETLSSKDVSGAEVV